MDRRNFLTVAGTAGIGLSAATLGASEPQPPSPEFFGVLVDTTTCIGCRECEKACAVENHNEVPDVDHDNALDTVRTTSEKSFTVVNRYETSKGEIFAKKQCMHCWQPACTAACLTNAMYKTDQGPVIWRSGKCMGCRFCMVSCPFNIPKFEYSAWNPRIRKCDLCWERLQQGKKPACVDACPTETLIFGLKRDLIEVARKRIYDNPEQYTHRIYGEHEVGGTGWLYLAAVPFEEIGFRTDLGTTPFPEYTRDFLYGVPLVLFGLPALLLGLNLMAGDDTEP
ncbi:MAG TPA: 4Fe-4S dicluster domain-containing protein [Gemmatimonadaceae bacterium]|nr:4Fe-4S dicluster domain-containing protein [Gemmatimonadaceae bacterium]